MRRPLVAAAFAALALTGCGGSTTRPGADLGRVLDPTLSTAGAVDSATGPMDLRLAAAATAVPRPMLEKFLRRTGFQAGYSRVWSTRDELTTALSYRFATAAAATGFVSYVADRLATSAYHQPFADPATPGSRGFELVSQVRGSTRFCVGELLAVGRDGLVVTRCAPYPLGPSAVTPLAARLRAHAQEATS